MLRSLYSGITGVKNQQAQMDVISNNIANVNTTGFKSNRITFADALSETVSGARGTAGNFGGANPVQIGRGSVVSSVDTNYKQGSLDSTGQVTDLAINGKGFFIVTDGTRRFFTRAGALQIQDDGSLMSQGGNYYMMGRVADNEGHLPSTTTINRIILPFGRKEPAKATNNIDLYCNLDKNGSKIEEWIGGASFYTNDGKAANGTTDLAEIEGLTMHLGDEIEITGTHRDGSKVMYENQSWKFTYGKDGTTINDLMNRINQAFNSTSVEGSSCTIDQNGKFRLIANSAGENDTTIFLTAITKHNASTESHESLDALKSINYKMSALGETGSSIDFDGNVININPSMTMREVLDQLNSNQDGFDYFAEIIDDGGITKLIVNRIDVDGITIDEVYRSGNTTDLADQNVSITSNLMDVSGAFLSTGNQIKIEGTNPDGTYKSSVFTFGSKDDGFDGLTIKDLMAKINKTFYGVTATLDNTTGKIMLTDNSSGESYSSIKLSNIDDSKGFNIEFTTERFSMTNKAFIMADNSPLDVDADLNDVNALNYVAGDKITIHATLIGGATKTVTFVYGDPDVDGNYDGLSLQDFVDKINNSNEFAGITADIVDGKIVFNDDSLTDEYNYTSFQIIDNASNIGTGGMATAFTSNAGTNNSVIQLPSFSVLVEGETGKHSTTIDVYDNIGQKHIVEINYTQDTEPGTNKWFWDIVIDDGKIAPHSGNSGTATFNEDGSLRAFLYDNGDALKFNAPGGGEVSISLNAGNAGSFSGMTQLASASTNVAIQQDGYALGVLNNINVDDQGIISGIYSNGVTKTLAQIAMANFTNEAGLQKEGNSLYSSNGSSGNAIVGWAGENNKSVIKAGYLESSNVDLTDEFAKLIISQRALEANSKVINTSDMILSTIIDRMKR
ncbi:MAG: flagellar hook-basal body complex protein [Candidatus Cloacimonadales bacterium]|jgi:flagellar hook protein FlgE|nr:flagellar hook-basal body complex protein [Candidatus Cloacimonadales bacterium]